MIIIIYKINVYFKEYLRYKKQPVMDIAIVRDNEEDLYAGIEQQQTDGLFHQVFDEIAKEYP